MPFAAAKSDRRRLPHKTPRRRKRQKPHRNQYQSKAPKDWHQLRRWPPQRTRIQVRTLSPLVFAVSPLKSEGNKKGRRKAAFKTSPPLGLASA